MIREHLERARRGEAGRADPLTPREQEIVKLIAEAENNDQITELLFIKRAMQPEVLQHLGAQPHRDAAHARGGQPRR